MIEKIIHYKLRMTDFKTWINQVEQIFGYYRLHIKQYYFTKVILLALLKDLSDNPAFYSTLILTYRMARSQSGESVLDVINLFQRKSRESIFPPKLKQQKQAILKATNSFRVYFCLKQHCFTILVQVQTTEQTFFYFLILGKSRFPPKKFYNIDRKFLG